MGACSCGPTSSSMLCSRHLISALVSILGIPQQAAAGWGWVAGQPLRCLLCCWGPAVRPVQQVSATASADSRASRISTSSAAAVACRQTHANQLTDHRRASCATLQQHVLSGFTIPCAILVAGLQCLLGPMGCWHAASSGTLLMPQMQCVLAWTLNGQQDRDARADRVPALSCMQAAGPWVEGLGAKVLSGPDTGVLTLFLTGPYRHGG